MILVTEKKSKRKLELVILPIEEEEPTRAEIINEVAKLVDLLQFH